MIRLVLRNYKEKKGFNLRQLAEELEENYSTVSLWITGKRYPTVRQIRKIREVTKVPYEQLLKQAPHPQGSGARGEPNEDPQESDPNVQERQEHNEFA